MAEKVEQDVREAAIRWGLKWENYGNCEVEGIRAGAYDGDDLLAAFAEMKEAGRQQGLREAAAIFTEAAEATRQDAADGLWEGIEDEVADAISTFNGHAARITALMEGEGK